MMTFVIVSVYDGGYHKRENTHKKISYTPITKSNCESQLPFFLAEPSDKSIHVF